MYLELEICACILRLKKQEPLKCRNTLNCLDQYAAQNIKYARPPIPSQPPTEKVFFQWHTQTWNIHTVKQSMPRSCSNGCSLNWLPPSKFFEFCQLTNQVVSLKNANDIHKKLNLVWVWNINYTLRTTKLLGGILVSLRPSVRLSVRPSVRPSRMSCPLCNIYSSGWILSILATNDHYHERVCRTQWPLTLTYIFKVIWPWLRKSCPLCSVYSSGQILFIFSTNDHYR